jgi:hypothetical protein
MQQGLAFYQRLLLLKVLEIFNSGIFHEQTVFYAPHHSHTKLNRGKKLFYLPRRSRGYKER